MRRAGEWKLASVHCYVVAVDPPAVTVPASVLDAYVGDYQHRDLTYSVSREGDHLSYIVTGGKPRPLLAETADVFFTPGRPRTRMIFQRDDGGRVARVVDRREGEDLIYARR